MFQRIIFDLDGTLINSEHKNVLGLIQVLKSNHNIDLSIEEGNKFKGQSGAKTLAEFNIPEESHDQFFNDWIKAVYEQEHEPNNLYPNVQEVLKQLKARNIPCGIVSSKPREAFLREKNIQDLLHYFDHIVLADDTLRHKPHPDPIEHYISLAKCSKDGVLYIGDNYSDLIAAREAGLEFALAMWGASSDYPQEEFIYRLEDMKDLLELTS